VPRTLISTVSYVLVITEWQSSDACFVRLVALNRASTGVSEMRGGNLS